jgi:hypothetical protein
MFILYFNNEWHKYYHATFEYNGWYKYNNYRANESAWIIPGSMDFEWE